MALPVPKAPIVMWTSRSLGSPNADAELRFPASGLSGLSGPLRNAVAEVSRLEPGAKVTVASLCCDVVCLVELRSRSWLKGDPSLDFGCRGRFGTENGRKGWKWARLKAG